MFGKLFRQTYSGSMRRKGADVFAVWPYILAHGDKRHFVEIDVGIIAFEIGMTEERVEAVVKYLAGPDDESRNKAHDGRRIVNVSGKVYRIVSGDEYQKIKTSDELLEYNRRKAQESRDRRRDWVGGGKSKPMDGEVADKRMAEAGVSQEDRDRIDAERMMEKLGKNAGLE